MPRAALDPFATAADRQRNRVSEGGRRRSKAAAEIGPAPITSAQRSKGTRLRNKCRDNLELFNTELFPNSTGLRPFGSVQKDSIAHDQHVIQHGGRICKAEPRGYGKTSRTSNDALWGVLNGYRKFIVVFASSQANAKKIIARWQTEILNNDLLLQAYPDLIWPLRALENRGQRCASQTYLGLPTSTVWTGDRIVFPTLDSPGSSAVLMAMPLPSCRGVSHTTPDGTVLRPDLVIFDDVQRDQDAGNPNTVAKLADLIDHSAMMLGGHSQTMSAIMNCTVRQMDDLSEHYLNKSSWMRVRYKFLQSPSKAEESFWLGEYATVRRSFDKDVPGDQLRAHKECLKLYQEKRAEADEGAVASWDWAYAWADTEVTEISAIQKAYNTLIDEGQEVFDCELQNQPPKRDASQLWMLDSRQIQAKILTPAPDATTVTAFVDVSNEILYYECWSWTGDETGYQIDGGCFPDQKRNDFDHRNPPVPLEKLFPRMTLEASLTHGLTALLHGYKDWPGLMKKTWTIGDTPVNVKLCLVDANGTHRDLICNLLTRSEHRSRLAPSFGVGLGAKRAPITTWKQYRDQKARDNWIFLKGKKGEIPGIQFCTNSFKTKFHRRLSLDVGTIGGLYLNPNATDLRMVASHYLAEEPSEVTVDGRTVTEWSQIRPDNHRLDCAVGSMVAASVLGIGLGRQAAARPTKKRRQYS